MADRPYDDSHRHYRLGCRPKKDEVAFQVVVEESDLWITAESDLSGQVLDEVRRLRGELKAFMTLRPDFAPSLAPVAVPDAAPSIIRQMAGAAAACDVGPMAAVAGTIAQAVADHFAEQSPNILVENGGDIFLHSTKSRTVGLLSRPEEDLSLALALARREFPLALCASSGRIGHSLSFGCGDLVVVKSKSGAFADAAATALANRLHNKRDVNAVIKQARRMSESGLLGVFAQLDEQLGIWGDMELVEL